MGVRLHDGAPQDAKRHGEVVAVILVSLRDRQSKKRRRQPIERRKRSLFSPFDALSEPFDAPYSSFDGVLVGKWSGSFLFQEKDGLFRDTCGGREVGRVPVRSTSARAANRRTAFAATRDSPRNQRAGTV